MGPAINDFVNILFYKADWCFPAYLLRTVFLQKQGWENLPKATQEPEVKRSLVVTVEEISKAGKDRIISSQSVKGWLILNINFRDDRIIYLSKHAMTKIINFNKLIDP